MTPGPSTNASPGVRTSKKYLTKRRGCVLLCNSGRAGIGLRLIDSSAKKMADEFFASLNRQLTGGTVPTGDTTGESTSATKPAGVVTLPEVAPETVTVRNTPELRGAWSGGLIAELYRVGWFALGVAVTLL